MAYRLYLYDYENNKIDILKANSEEYIVGESYSESLTEDKNGISELTFILPYSEISTETGLEIPNRRLIQAKAEYLIKLVEDGETPKWFKLKSPEEQDNNGKLEVAFTATSTAYDLGKKNTQLISDETDTAENLVIYAIQSTDWTVGTVDSFGGATLTLKSTTASNSLDLLNQIATLFDGYLDFNTDTKQVNLFSNDNVLDTQINFRTDKNIKTLTRITDTNDIVTKLYGFGGDTNTGIVGIQEANPTNEPYVLNFGHYIGIGLINSTKQAQITQFELDITAINSSLASAQSDINNTTLQISLKTTELNQKTILRSSKQARVDEIDTILTIETNATKRSTLESEKTILESEILVLDSEIATLVSDLATLNATLISQQTIYDGFVSDKNNLITTFESDDVLGKFIFEGAYTNSNLILSQSIYDETVSVLNDVSIPKVYYNLNIADLSNLPEFAVEKFKLHNIIRVTNTELNIDTKLRITRIIRDLADPFNVNIDISNFYSNYEELERDLYRSAEILRQQKAYYDRSQLALNPNETLSTDFLQNTFDIETFNRTYGTNGSASEGDSGVIYTSVNDSDKKVRIDGDGVFISNDAGTTWINTLDARGSNVQNVYGGVLDVTEVYLKGDTYFFWSGDGLFAFDSSGGDNNPATAQKYIVYNKDGLFFTMDGGATYEIELSWTNGLKIGAGDDQTVQITSDEGIQVFDDQAIPQERLKIGKYTDTGTNNAYGFIARDSTGTVTVELLSDGSLEVTTGTFRGNIITEANAFIGNDLYLGDQSSTTETKRVRFSTGTILSGGTNGTTPTFRISTNDLNIVDPSSISLGNALTTGNITGTWQLNGDAIATEVYVDDEINNAISGFSGTVSPVNSISVSNGLVTSVS